MKKLFYFLIGLIVLVMTCVVTCPSKDAHSEAIMKLVNGVLDENFSKSANTELEQSLAIFGTALGSGIIEFVLDKKLIVDDYFVCSVARVTFEGKTTIVSVGILNHVFTESEDDFRERIKK